MEFKAGLFFECERVSQCKFERECVFVGKCALHCADFNRNEQFQISSVQVLSGLVRSLLILFFQFLVI